jgi:hypothetical protein
MAMTIWQRLAAAALLCASARAAAQPAQKASPAPPADARGAEETRRITVARLGFPEGVALEGATAAAVMDFPLPVSTHVLRGTLSLVLDVTKTVVAGSNVQIFVNGTRRVVLPRVDGSPAPAEISIPLTPADLLRPSTRVEVRTFLAVGKDRCVDERLGSAFATVRPESFLEYAFDRAGPATPASTWALLRDTVHVSVPNRALTPNEFALAYRLFLELRAAGHEVLLDRTTPGADFFLDSAAGITGMLSWRALAARPHAIRASDPTLDEMGVTDLTHFYGYRTTWRIPIDLRTLPPDRVPSRMDLEVASVPRGVERGVQFFVYLNGTLLRAVNIGDDGRSAKLQVDLPQYLLSTYNELRVDAQRQRDRGGDCQQAEALYPAQIFGSSRLHTELATKTPTLFTGASLRLPEQFPLYLPATALSQPDVFVPVTGSLARGLWGWREPAMHFYAANAKVEPDRGFVVIGSQNVLPHDGPVRDSAGTLVARGAAIGAISIGSAGGNDVTTQVVHTGGHDGILVTLGRSGARIPDQPEAYANADLVIQQSPGALLTISTSGLRADVLYGDYAWLQRFAWTLPLIVATTVGILLVIALAYISWQRRRRRERSARAVSA